MILNIPQAIYSYFNSPSVFKNIMQQSGECYRAQPGRKTIRTLLAGEDCFIKQHTGVGYLEILKNLCALRWPVIGAKNEWQALEKCQQVGIATAELIGYGEQGINPAHQHSFLITRALHDVESLAKVCERWRRDPPTWQYKREIIKSVALITRRLHQAGMNHRDLYLCHFLLDKRAAQTVRLYLMDLHRVVIRKNVPRRWLIKDLAALFYSSLNDEFSAKDYFYFLKIYTSKRLKDIFADKLFPQVLNKAVSLYKKEYGFDPNLPQWFVPKKSLLETLNQLGTIKKPGLLGLRLATTGNEYLHIEETLRVLPNQRWVMKGRWENKPVVAKIFADEKKYRRELENIILLNKTDILTAPVLYQGQLNDLYIIIFEFVAGDKDFEDDLKPLITLIAAHHQQGIIQPDIHMHNFIKVQNGIVTLDAGEIINHNGVAIDKVHGFSNLALLLAQFWGLSEAELTNYFNDYCQIRNFSCTAQDLKYFLAQVKRYKDKRKKRKLDKIFRTCSAVTRWNGFKQHVLLENSHYSPTLCFFLHNIEQAFKQPALVYLKQGNSSTVIKLTIDGHAYVIKRYNVKNIWQSLKTTLTPTRAARSWYNAHLCEVVGIAASKPVGMVEKKFFGFKHTAYFMMQEVPGISLRDYFKQDLAHRSNEQEMIAQLCLLFSKLKAEHIVHNDLKDTNFMLFQDKVFLLDLDSMRSVSCSNAFNAAHKKDLKRFLHNFKHQPAILNQMTDVYLR